MTKIAVLVGSLREQSFNRKLADVIARNLEGIDVEYVPMDMPLFSEDLEQVPPEVVVKARGIVADAHAVLFVTPEYNRSISGVLKNAIDWLSRPYANGVIQNKKAAIIGATMSPLGTASAQNHLRSIVGYLNMQLMGQPELYVSISRDIVGEDGSLSETEPMRQYAAALQAFVTK